MGLKNIKQIIYRRKKNVRYWFIKLINFLIIIKFNVFKFLNKRKTNRIMSGNYTDNEVSESNLPNKIKKLMIKNKIDKNE